MVGGDFIMSYDFYSVFSNEREEKVDWYKTRKRNLCLTAKQKITALYKNKNREEGKNKLKKVIDNSEYYFKDNQKYFLNPSNNHGSELQDRKDALESLINDNNKFSFELKKPLLTNGEESFYIHENPIAKEKVFKVPMIRASSIKGKTRWVATRRLVENLLGDENDIENIEIIFEERARIVRIFGNEKENMSRYLNRKIAEIYDDRNPEEVEKEFKKYLKDQGYLKNKIESRRGRLQFYPVFFDEIGLEVITPIERETGTADKPIQLEKVPEEAEGKLRLYYYPFDILDEEGVKKQKNEDKEIIVNALYDMLTRYGGGAKTADGYGVAKREGSLEDKESLKEVIFDD